MIPEKQIFRPMKWELYPEKQTRFSDFVTTIEITDEAAGEFIVIRQPHHLNNEGLAIEQGEWQAFKDAVDHVFGEIEKHKVEEGKNE